MRNRLKTLGILAVFVAASFVGVKGSAAATGNVSVPMPGVGTVNVNLAGGSDLAVNTTPTAPVSSSGTPDQEIYSNYLQQVGSPASIYTVFCWKVQIASANLHAVINNDADWKCGVMSTVSAPLLVTDLPSTPVTGALGTSAPNTCSWILPYDPTTGACGGMDWTAAPGMGNTSPTGPDIMPNFDAYVGQSLAFDVLTNWCSYLAPSGIAASTFTANLSQYVPWELGCGNTDPTFTLGASMRTLAAAAPTKETAFKVKVQASPYDCHVPKVKGLTLRKAKARLHKANCGAAVRYVKGARAGRVKYQPLKVGTGRPRGYKVKLAVVR